VEASKKFLENSLAKLKLAGSPAAPQTLGPPRVAFFSLKKKKKETRRLLALRPACHPSLAVGACLEGGR